MSTPLLQKIFPPPKFLLMPAAGIDISDETIRYLELKESRHGLVLGKFGEISLSPGVIAEGEIKKQSELKNALARIAKETKFEFAHVSLPEQKGYLVKVRIPNMKQSEIRGNLELQLEDHVPLSAAEAIFDYEVLDEGNDYIDINLSVFSRKIAEDYLDAFLGTGLAPKVFEIEAQAIGRAVVPQGSKSAYMIVDLESTKTGISIVNERAVQFTSSITVGGNTIAAALSKSLSISREDAEKLMRERGLAQTKGKDEAFSVFVSNMSALRDEIQRHLLYWNTHGDEGNRARIPIEKIFVCGEEATIPGLIDYLAAGLKTKVELAHPMQNVNELTRYVPEIPFGESLGYATAVGLALYGRSY